MNRQSFPRRASTLAVLCALVLSVLAARGVGASSATHSVAGKKVCKVVKKHGKKRRVCRVVQTTPTATPAASSHLFDAPSGIAVDAQGNVYVADAVRDHIVKLAPDGHVLATVGSKGTAPGQFDQPWGVTLDSQGNIYVTEASGANFNGQMVSKPRRIQKLSPDGAPLAQFTDSASGFTTPCSTAVDGSGTIYVTDYPNGQILKLSPSGQRLARIQTSDMGACGIALDPAGNIYVSQAFTEDIAKYAPDGTKTATLGPQGHVDPPFGVALDAQGNIYMVRVDGSHVLKISPSGQVLTKWGQAGSSLGEFRFNELQMLGIAVDAQGNVYVSDPGNERVEKFSPAGQVIAVWK